MSHQLPWNEDTRMNLSDFLQKSMSFASVIMENHQAQSQASKHLGSLLKLQQQQQPERGSGAEGNDATAQGVLDQLFTAAEERMETDNDKRVVGLLKSQVVTFIKTTLGVHGFDHGDRPQQGKSSDNQPSLSWSDVSTMPDEPSHSPRPARLDEDDDDEDDGFAERAETLHLEKLALEYNTYDKGDDEPDSDHEDVQPAVLSRGIQPRGVQSRGGDGFQTVQKKRYRRNQYRRQGGVACQEFRPTYLHSLPSDTYCIPIFFPSEDSYDASRKPRTDCMFHGALSMAQKTLHIAVFSLTDNKTANVLIDAYERGVDVKIVTDNDQLDGKGADVRRLHQDYGIPFKTDSSEQFMHNKFAVIDERIVITGSFNWSIGARFKNMENVIITNIPSLAKAYECEFHKLWQDLHYE